MTPYRAILRYYRCDTLYRAIVFEGGWHSPKMVRYPPLVLNLHRHICAIPHFAIYRTIIVRYPTKTNTKEFCDTIATSIARCEKYLCWASKPKQNTPTIGGRTARNAKKKGTSVGCCSLQVSRDMKFIAAGPLRFSGSQRKDLAPDAGGEKNAESCHVSGCYGFVSVLTSAQLRWPSCDASGDDIALSPLVNC